ncbi:MAG: MBOAT family protein [Moorea sp. SIO1F2]|uniref:MBOAT family O-acyltransferase n=1 Tax=Moorena sp. SIO1F2 TaxID=2607819 RepID=UPI0013BB3BAE|nr:MBOAT family protein [Moorena sp. SIO1F2]NET83882.1 MBOAT family protein [Moorena sp. SIO1F2]
MLFNSPEFIFLFLPLTLFFFFMLGRKGYYQGAIAFLVAASLLFYAWWNPPYLALLIFSIFFNYTVGSALSKRLILSVSPKLLLVLGIAVNLALIGYFKYANFFVYNVSFILGKTFNFDQIILPLAISFFTFQQITYLVDAYRGETQDYSFLEYCLFVTFFPQLIAGPIVHHKEVMPQFANKSIYRFNPEDLAVGVTIFSIGLIKKVLIADIAGLYATPVFNAAASGELLTFYDAWSGALFYTFQLYFDFSGYSEMAIGAARMFGIKLPLNFNSPYKAVNISDFWRRWHITLSNFLRDYLYIPLGGNRKGELRRNLNLIITMLLGGLWHGAGWTFVLWGGLHGVYLCLNHQWRSCRKFLGHDLKKSNWWSRTISCFITFIAVVFGWVLFRADNLDSASLMVQTMLGINGISLSASMVTFKKLLIILFLFIWLIPNSQQWMEQYKPALNLPVVKTYSNWYSQVWKKLQWQPNQTFGIIIGVLLFIAIKTILTAVDSEFLYFNF